MKSLLMEDRMFEFKYPYRNADNYVEMFKQEIYDSSDDELDQTHDMPIQTDAMESDGIDLCDEETCEVLSDQFLNEFYPSCAIFDDGDDDLRSKLCAAMSFQVYFKIG